MYRQILSSFSFLLPDFIVSTALIFLQSTDNEVGSLINRKAKAEGVTLGQKVNHTYLLT